MTSAGKEVGTRHLGRASPPRSGPIALAIVRREVEPGDEVAVGDGVTATVVELPFDRSVRQAPSLCRQRALCTESRRPLEARKATQTERRRSLSAESPLLGGPLAAEAGAEEPRVAPAPPTTPTPTSTGFPAPEPRASRRRCATCTGLIAPPGPGAPGRRLGPLGARVPDDGAGAQLLLPVLVQGRGRGHRERARRPAARCSPRTTPARCRRTRR